ncbi:MAG: right-handed parallel beta-helix repeat-containing protein, partial [Candidatus Bathyarchaeota archaeon]
YYWIDKHDTTVPLDAGCVILVNCSNMTIQNLNISCNNWQGVFLIQTINSTIEGNNITSNQYGIFLLNASNNQIHENYLQNFVSIQFQNSNNNTIHDNTLTGSGNWGAIGFSTSNGNLFYRNNFTDNYIHVLLDEFSVNAWNSSYSIGGNYWDNYEDRYSTARDESSGPYQNITGSDGIWDDPWMMNDDNIDKYPIVPEFENVLTLTLLMIITLTLILILKKSIRRQPNQT